ncbi:uncharacterized protein LOC143368914 [Andrena cerasifolii]|uniref:uncharacterized protein LOC143368914 n=1 Tax=Andrena cerasifolii TaxID=2819439 RepID=UPI004037ECE6
MKNIGEVLGYIVVAYIYIAVVASKQFNSEVTQTSTHSNTTHVGAKAINPGEEEEDDFVPYRGEYSNVFDWILLRVMSKREPGNLLLSPISLKIALVLLYEGAQDETARQLASAMQLPVSRTATRDRFTTVLQSLQATTSAYSLNMGTRIYIDSNILVRERYGAIVKTFYNTNVITANMSDARPLVDSINAWASTVTDGNIHKMITDESSVENSLMLIMNAIFFKGSWRGRYFSPEDTRTEEFHTSQNRTVLVPFMRTINRFYYYESPDLDAKILRIPYHGLKFAMYLVLPRARNGIEHLINEINPFALTRHVWLMEHLFVDVLIPKFKFEFSSHLEPVLRELGIQDIFDDTATLTGIARARRTSKHLKVSDIVQKTGIEVNENGTTAYATTVVQLGNKIGDEAFHATHPFLFYIEDESTGTILYMGKMANPLDTSTNTVDVEELPSRFQPDVLAAEPVLQAGFNTEDRKNLFNTYFTQALNKEYNGNLVSSPASVGAALAMLSEGAGGDTRRELISVLRLPEDGTRIREIMEHTLTSLKRNENGTEIDLATSLWVHKDLTVLDNYKYTLQSYYKADIQNVNFAESQSAAKLIDDWVRRATRSKISSPLVNDLPDDTRLMLTSVVYFKGRWLKSFDKAKTKLQCFYMPNGECRNTYFMKHESTYRYAYVSSIEAEILEIPYSDGKTSMLTLLPRKSGIDPYLRILSTDLATIPVSAIFANLKERDVTIHLPKFTIESNLNLLPTLQDLGIESIFNSNANFTEIISNGSLQVTSLLQNVKIEVDEEGTLAAADTEVGFGFLSSLGNDVKLDRPFLFFIVDTVTNTTLFSGRFIGPL